MPGDPAHTTWYFYNGVNQQTCVVDALADTTFSSDATPTSRPADGTMTTYDALGRVLTVTDQLGNTTSTCTTTSAARSRPSRPTQHGPASQSDAACPKTYYGYDADGNLTSVTTPARLHHLLRYDNLNRRTHGRPTPWASTLAIRTHDHDGLQCPRVSPTGDGCPRPANRRIIMTMSAGRRSTSHPTIRPPASAPDDQLIRYSLRP